MPIDRRLKNLRIEMAKIEADAILITKRENYMYMSGFTGTSAYLFITAKQAFLITDFRYIEQASVQAPQFQIIRYTGNIFDAINNLIESCKIHKLAFEEAFITVANYNEYVKKLKIDEFLPICDLVENLRQVKDESEIDLIKKAVEIADKSFENILKFIKPGITEIDIAAELEYQMKKQGASAPSFETIVASGKRSSMPHGIASEKIIEAGDSVTMDFGALYKGYCSDITRTVFLGTPSDKMKEIYDIVLNAQVTAIEGIKKGMTGKEVDALARDVIAKAGYENDFGHGLGHGVGLEIHEEPKISLMGSSKIKKDMVFTVEPGIYLNNFGGVRIEDIIVVCNEKAEILTRAPKEMIVI